MNSAPQKTLVIIDDEKSHTWPLTQLLAEHLTCPIATFSRPFEALEALPNINVGVVVTDYYMPQMNGGAFIEKASEFLRDVPFVLITGHTLGMINRAELDSLSALKAVLSKPFAWNDLADVVISLWPERDVTMLRSEPTHSASL